MSLNFQKNMIYFKEISPNFQKNLINFVRKFHVIYRSLM